MLTYIVRRSLYMVPTLAAISVIIFVIINLPPGDYVTSLLTARAASGDTIAPGEEERLREFYGLDRSVLHQYWLWITRIVTEGDMGMSLNYIRPVGDLIGERLPMTLVLSGAALLFTIAMAFPIGMYAAVRQYSVGDYVATTIGFLGLSIPNFLLALILMYVGLHWFAYVPSGLCSPEFCAAGWNAGRILDLLAHLWLPVIVIGTAGTAGLIRVLRANLLDELRRPYVVAARMRGLAEWRILFRYPLRVAMNPFVSTAGWLLPLLFVGDVIVGRILGLPTIGPLLLESLEQQDMYLAGSLIMVISLLTVIGTLISDLLLAWLDPRVRLGMGRAERTGAQ